MIKGPPYFPAMPVLSTVVAFSSLDRHPTPAPIASFVQAVALLHSIHYIASTVAPSICIGSQLYALSFESKTIDHEIYYVECVDIPSSELTAKVSDQGFIMSSPGIDKGLIEVH